MIDSPHIGGLTEQKWLLLLPIFGDKLTRFVAEGGLRNMVDKELARIIQRSKGEPSGAKAISLYLGGACKRTF